MLKELKFKKNQKINTMNIKMAINSQLSTIESKKQTRQPAEQKQDRRSFGETSVWKGKGESGGKGAGIKKYKLVGTK